MKVGAAMVFGALFGLFLVWTLEKTARHGHFVQRL